MEKREAHVIDIVPYDRFELKPAHFGLLKSCLVVENGVI